MKKHRFLLLSALVAIMLLIFLYTYDHVSLLPDQLTGAYIAGNGPYQLAFSADTNGGIFYYADQASSRYIQGRLQFQEDSSYLLICENPDNSAILPDQEITCGNLTLTLTVDGNSLTFKKVSKSPVLIGSPDCYS